MNQQSLLRVLELSARSHGLDLREEFVKQTVQAFEAMWTRCPEHLQCHNDWVNPYLDQKNKPQGL